MSDKKELVCFLGLKGTGKGYNSTIFTENGYTKISMADPLRDMLWNILGHKPKDYDKFKNAEISSKTVKKVLGIFSVGVTEVFTTGRGLLQNIGTIMKQHFGENFWCNLWYDEVQKHDKVVTDDIRFISEIKKALSLKRKGYRVRFYWCAWEGADYENILKDTHESEALNQFIYKNMFTYNLSDMDVIPEKVIRNIMKDFEAL